MERMNEPPEAYTLFRHNSVESSRRLNYPWKPSSARGFSKFASFGKRRNTDTWRSQTNTSSEKDGPIVSRSAIASIDLRRRSNTV